MAARTRLAIVATHPIQYNAPWFRLLAQRDDLDLRVFYLWDFGVAHRMDRGFQQALSWDIPLLDGYDSEFIPNVSRRPGTHHLLGLRNPSLVRRVAEYRPDAVLVFGYNFAALYEFLARWPRRAAPLLFRGDSHRLVRDSGWRAAVRGLVTSRVLRRFDACLYVGLANQRYFVDHGVDPKRLFFAPHSVDNARFTVARGTADRAATEWRDELGIPQHHRVVLFCGKLEPKKRPGDLLDAFIALEPERATLLFVGAGVLEDDLRRRAQGRSQVVFAAFQNQQRMPTVYAMADLLVLPSFGRGETWGLVVNEAMCLGCPVIVSTHVGCAEDLVTDGVTGLVFPAGDRAALVEALRRALADDRMRRTWGEAASARVKRYSYAEATAGLLDALQFVGAARHA